VFDTSPDFVGLLDPERLFGAAVFGLWVGMLGSAFVHADLQMTLEVRKD
jgi:hypothetical protein